MNRTLMNPIALLLVLTFAAGVWGDDAPKKTKTHYTIGKETTFVDGPLDKDGYIDYTAAVNKRLSKGITPENNANVLIWKALGPRPEGKRMPGEFFRQMGMEEPAESGEYFVGLYKFGTERLKADAALQKQLTDQMLIAYQRPWTAFEYPHFAEWLDINEKPLALVVEGVTRSQYFNPLTPPKTDKGTTGLLNNPVPGVQKCRDLAAALACKATSLIAENRFEDAWQYLLACHRLARHIGRGGMNIDSLVGVSLDAVASKADLAFLAQPEIGAEQFQNCLRDLRNLPPLPVTADKMDLGERFVVLEIIALVDRHGVGYLESFGEAPPKAPDPIAVAMMEEIDFDPGLNNTNRRYDRLVAAFREPNWPIRKQKIEAIEKELHSKKNAIHNLLEELAKVVAIGKDVPQTKGSLIADRINVFMISSAFTVQEAVDRAEQTQRNLHIAFALAAFQRDQGSYPETLDALVPKYLPRVPDDYFTDKPLVYRPDAKGYVLYSLGPNGKDDGGRGHGSGIRADDLSVRMPPSRPETPRKLNADEDGTSTWTWIGIVGCTLLVAGFFFWILRVSRRGKGYFRAG